ncbi:MAG: hypothetical protein GY797_00890 [Deltaproteobacteria bacterium]|nr:hypothetical protein [Deltaproteobacteria bacterium]
MRQSTSTRLAEPNTFGEQIELFEHEAQQKYYTAIQDIQTEVLSDRFNRLLEFRIIPTLGRIGFDEQLCWTLFKITAPAWKLIGPVGDDVELMYPFLIKNIGEIRRGIISNLRKNSRVRSKLGEMAPQATYSLINRAMHPAKLFEDFNDISLSWIILPRAYDLLEKDHSRYMLIYIKYLDKETESEFTKILARIIIEFVGNYSLKYLDDVQIKDQMVDALYYGYASMFWKNLRNPPIGLEDGLVFESFFRWAKMIHGRFGSANKDMAKTTERMKEEKEKTFPAYNDFGLAHHNHYDVHRFFVALRHGIPGVESVVRYFGIGGPLLRNKTDGRLPYVAVPKTLNVLFRQIKKRYCFETPRTKKSIREFLSRLRSNYNLEHINTVLSGDEASETLRFVGPRVISIIQDLAASMHLRLAQK